MFKHVSKVPYEVIAVRTENISDYQETLDNNSSFSDSSSEFSGFDIVSEKALADRLLKLKKTCGDMEESFSGSEQGHESSDSEDIKLINEAVSDINDSFTLLRTIDTDIIENFCETSKDLSSDGSDNNPSYKLPKDNQEDSSTDEDVPLSFVPRGKHF